MKNSLLFSLFLLLLSACSNSFEEEHLHGAWHLKETQVNSPHDTTYTENYWTVMEFEEDSFFLHTNSTTEYVSREGKYSLKDSLVSFEWTHLSGDTAIGHSTITLLSAQNLVFEDDGITNIYRKTRTKDDYFSDPVSPPQIVVGDSTSSN